MGTRLFVGNLSWNTTEDILQGAFEQAGFTPKSVSILNDRETGRSRGFGFVEMNSDEEAQNAIQAMDGQDIDGRSLRVNEAEERRPRSGGGGGGGGGRGGYGGGGGGGRGDRW
ncbi:MAG: RNA recognition motif domain-containing protein [Planctomycetota bacterium]